MVAHHQAVVDSRQSALGSLTERTVCLSVGHSADSAVSQCQPHWVLCLSDRPCIHVTTPARPQPAASLHPDPIDLALNPSSHHPRPTAEPTDWFHRGTDKTTRTKSTPWITVRSCSSVFVPPRGSHPPPYMLALRSDKSPIHSSSVPSPAAANSMSFAPTPRPSSTKRHGCECATTRCLSAKQKGRLIYVMGPQLAKLLPPVHPGFRKAGRAWRAKASED